MSRNEIHPSATVADDLVMGEGNRIGPGAVIASGVKMGSENVIWANAYVGPGTTLGDRNHIHMGAIVGHEPQDIEFEGVPSCTAIGSDNRFREYCTIHRGTEEGSSTVIGDGNFFMAYSHVAHNCKVGNKVVLVNQASMAGRCEIHDNAQMSGLTVLHQYTRVGRLAFLSGLSGTNKDIPPFCIGYGRPAVIVSVNRVGLKRAGFSRELRAEIKEAFNLMYRSKLILSEALAAIEEKFDSDAIKELVTFCRESKRGISIGQQQDGESRRKRDFEVSGDDT